MTIRVEVKGISGCIAIQDTGIGIAPQHLPLIFERFYRVDPARSQRVEGSGLGLSIVEWIVHAHGGSIDVESQEGRGSTFSVTLPLAGQEKLGEINDMRCRDTTRDLRNG